MNLFFLYYQFKFSTASTACAPLEKGGGIACPLCYLCSSWVVPRIPQGVAAVPTFKVLGLAI